MDRQPEVTAVTLFGGGARMLRTGPCSSGFERVEGGLGGVEVVRRKRGKGRSELGFVDSSRFFFSQCDPQKFSTDKHNSPTGKGRGKIGDWDDVGAKKD